MTSLPRPTPEEFNPFYARYLTEASAPHDDVMALLVAQEAQIAAGGRLGPKQADHAYGADKWTVKEVLGHLADAERVFSYRAMRFARNDQTELPGFDENRYVPAGGFRSRPIGDVAEELAAVRRATVALYRSMTPEQAAIIGNANGSPCTARAMAWITAGHFAHHMTILKERYGVTL